MCVVSFADFGHPDKALYLEYLRSCTNVAVCGSCGCGVGVGQRVSGGFVGSGVCDSWKFGGASGDVGGVRSGGEGSHWCGGWRTGTGEERVGGFVVEPEDGVFAQCTLGRSEPVRVAGDVRGCDSYGRGADVAVGGSTGASGLSTPGGVRGPNYLRNQRSRLEKKVRAEQKKIAEAEARGRGNRVVDAEVAERERKVKLMRLERQELQEQRKLDKLKSPATMIEDAMRQVALAAKYAKMANDTKVAAWAADLTSASAESAARSAGYSSEASSRVGDKSRVQTVASSASSGGGCTSSAVGGEAIAADSTERPKVFSRVVDRGPGGQSFVNAAGDHVKLGGSTYTKAESRDWVLRRGYVQKYNLPGRTLEQVCEASRMSKAEAIKYNDFVRGGSLSVPLIGAVKPVAAVKSSGAKESTGSGWFSFR